eukprot:UN01520
MLKCNADNKTELNLRNNNHLKFSTLKSSNTAICVIPLTSNNFLTILKSCLRDDLYCLRSCYKCGLGTHEDFIFLKLVVAQVRIKNFQQRI